MLKPIADIGLDPYQNLAGAIISFAYYDLFKKENREDAYNFFFTERFYQLGDIVGLSPVRIASIQERVSQVYEGKISRTRKVSWHGSKGS